MKNSSGDQGDNVLRDILWLERWLTKVSYLDFGSELDCEIAYEKVQNVKDHFQNAVVVPKPGCDGG
jgi:hypothetical protein